MCPCSSPPVDKHSVLFSHEIDEIKRSLQLKNMDKTQSLRNQKIFKKFFTHLDAVSIKEGSEQND